MKHLLALTVIIAGFVYAGHIEQHDLKLQEAAYTCQSSTEYTTPTYQQCWDNQFENNTDH